jgi:hypothetical protein
VTRSNGTRLNAGNQDFSKRRVRTDNGTGNGTRLSGVALNKSVRTALGTKNGTELSGEL